MQVQERRQDLLQELQYVLPPPCAFTLLTHLFCLVRLLKEQEEWLLTQDLDENILHSFLLLQQELTHQSSRAIQLPAHTSLAVDQRPGHQPYGVFIPLAFLLIYCFSCCSYRLLGCIGEQHVLL